MRPPAAPYSLPDLSRIDIQTILSPEAVAFVRAARDGCLLPPHPSRQREMENAIANATRDMGEAATYLIGDLRCRAKGDALLALARHGMHENSHEGVPIFNWMALVQSEVEQVATLDLAIAPLFAGYWNPASNVARTTNRNAPLVDTLLAWSTRFGWPSRWFRLLATLYDAPEPDTHAACREAIGDIRRTPHGTGERLCKWPRHLRAIREAAARDHSAGRDIEWGRSMPGAVHSLDILGHVYDLHAPELGGECMLTLETLVEAGAELHPPYAAGSALSIILGLAYAKGPPLAARLLELRPDLAEKTPDFERKHAQMRSFLMEDGDLDQANSVAAVLMRRAAMKPTPPASISRRPRARSGVF